MLSNRKTVLIVDQSAQAREGLRTLLSMSPDIRVVGEADTAARALEMAKLYKPMVALVGITEPVIDALQAISLLTGAAEIPVVALSSVDEQELMLKAMRSGARDWLLKPPKLEDAVQAIHRLSEPLGQEQRKGYIITVVGPKGGVGKSVLSANLSAYLALERHKPVIAVDLDMDGGGVLAALLDLHPTITWGDIARLQDRVTADHLNKALVRHDKLPLSLMAVPSYGSNAEPPFTHHVEDILDLMVSMADTIVVDAGRGNRELTHAALVRADRVLVVSVPEVPALDMAAKQIDFLTGSLGIPKERIRFVLSRIPAKSPIKAVDVEEGLGLEVAFEIPEDPAVSWAICESHLLALSRSSSPVLKAISRIANGVFQTVEEKPVKAIYVPWWKRVLKRS